MVKKMEKILVAPDQGRQQIEASQMEDPYDAYSLSPGQLS